MKHIPSLQLSLRAATAALLAVAAAQFLHLQHPLYALISAVIVTDLEVAQTRKLALPRFTGTVVGSAIGATIHTVLLPSLWTIGSGIFLAMFASHVISLPAAAKVPGYVSGIILLDHGDSFHHATAHDGVQIIYCHAKNKGMWFMPGIGMGPMQPKGLGILKQIVEGR